MLSPLMAVVGVVAVFAVSFSLYLTGSLNHHSYFFLPIFLLIVYHTLVMQLRERRTAYPHRSWLPAIKKSLAKYVFWLLVLGAAYGIYVHHPFYLRFAPNTAAMLWFFMKLYAVLGLPYLVYVEVRRTGRFEWLNDPYLKLLSFAKVIFSRRWRRLRYRCTKTGYKSLFLS